MKVVGCCHGIFGCGRVLPWSLWGVAMDVGRGFGCARDLGKCDRGVTMQLFVGFDGSANPETPFFCPFGVSMVDTPWSACRLKKEHVYCGVFMAGRDSESQGVSMHQQ